MTVDTASTNPPRIAGLPVRPWARQLASLRHVLITASDYACLWLIYEPDLDRKYILARRVWDLSWCADVLARRLVHLAGDEACLNDPAVLRPDATLLQLLRSAGAEGGVDAFGRVFVPALGTAVRTLRSQSDPLLDEGSWTALDQIERRLAEPTPRITGHPPTASTDALTASTQPAFPVDLPDVLRPGRPSAHPALRGCDWPDPHEDTAGFLHSVALGVEVCAAEVCAETMLRHPDMPLGLRFDLARQVNDEMRHAQLLLARASELGVRPFEIPYDTYTWDLLRPAESLLDRLTLEQRLGEGNGLDDAAAMRDHYLQAADLRTATIFDFITADEVTHVRCGNYWIRTLLNDQQERIDAQEGAVRSKVARAGLHVRMPRRPNLPLRRLAGFTDVELARMEQRTRSTAR